MLKLKMMLCVMTLPLVVVGCTSAVLRRQARKPATLSGVIQPDSGRVSAEYDYFTLRERLITMQKNNWKEPRSILMSSVDRVAHIDGQLMQLL